jgi:hypothetical protein
LVLIQATASEGRAVQDVCQRCGFALPLVVSRRSPLSVAMKLVDVLEVR